MPRIFRSLLVAAFVAAFTVPALADDDKKGTSKADLPAAVWKAVTDKYPGAELMKWELDEDDGEVEYEVKIKVDGKKRELEITPQGRITDDDED